MLCLDLVAFTATETNARGATSALFRRLEHWQALLSRGALGELGPQEIRGLIGELCVLLRLASSAGIASTLSSWVAPDEHPQDFALGTRLLEVKTRLASSRQQVQISSLEQLETGELPMYLVVVELAPSDEDPAISLSAIAGQVVALAAADGLSTRDRAERLLLLRGYTELETYDADRYVVSDERAFIVGDGFPRIVRSATDRRVREAKYVLDLTALESFERDVDEAYSATGQE